MKNVITIFSFLLISSIGLSQHLIQSDTTISKTISVLESFELVFEFSPGTGYVWYLPNDFDSTQVAIQLKNIVLKEGHGPKGGKYIYTYEYTGLTTGTFLLEYAFGRPWLQEKLEICKLVIIVE
ncbi:MAG: hypothetical protein FD170_2799 [Bacteroidetes bacterium]|nr:MAG: hypothetical protein FD170_2799 [Bacteroidota bacterium]